MNNDITFTLTIQSMFLYTTESTWEIKLSNEQNNNGNHSTLKKKQY